MKSLSIVVLAGAGLLRLLSPSAAAAQTPNAPAALPDAPEDPAAAGPAVDYVKDVQPIFQASCVKCHGLDAEKPKKKPAAGFRLDDKAASMKGGRSGAAIVPGDSKNSLLFKLLSGPVTMPDKDEDKEIDPMPKVKRGEKWKPLSADQISVIQRWIDQGAKRPD
jgi:mono/diheme cytochrome c family protein